MKGKNKEEWIVQGYIFASEKGIENLKIENIGREIKKNKSSFYHYFGDLHLFELELLKHHIHRSEIFAGKIEHCQNIRPDLLETVIEHKTDLLFHKQLRFNRDNQEYEKCFNKAYANYEKVALEKWVEFFGLEQKRLFAETFVHFFAENFLLKITAENFNYDWLSNYVDELQIMLRQMDLGKK